MNKGYLQQAPAASPGAERLLLLCGILSSLYYIGLNILTVLLYKGYNPASQTVSELSAIGAPTRPLWVGLITVYALLLFAFGWGIWLSGNSRRPLRWVGAFILVHAIVGVFWPPMHQRQVLAAGGATLTDDLHIAFTFITVPLMMLQVGFGAAAFGPRFRFYSILTLFILVLFGILTGLDASNMTKDLPTPLMGVWERINIGVYMVWIIAFAVLLLKANKKIPTGIKRSSKTVLKGEYRFP